MDRSNEPDFADAQHEITYLREQLASERAAREKAETSLRVRTIEYEEMQRAQEASAAGVAEQRARAEQAELERDVARESADDWKTCYERAEADNAELLKGLRHARLVLAMLRDTDNPKARRASAERAVAAADAVLMPDYPGAALLERLRALEKVGEQVKGALGQDAIDTEWAEAIAGHVRAADALRGKA